MILVVLDSFKGSLTSIEAGIAAKRGIESINPDEEVIVKALADGGEGTYKTLIEALGGEEITILVKDPLGREIYAHYGILNENTAVMEMAQASGIALLRPEELNPLRANTYGFGQMILDAYNKGIRNFIIGIGGSATTELGIGMLEAFGFKMLDKNGLILKSTLENMGFIERVDDSEVNKELFDINIQLACDVKNPLCGKDGATAVFGPQKGVRKDQIELFDNKICSFAKILSCYSNNDYALCEGTGAAGGLGFTLMSLFKNLKVKSGADLIIEKLRIEEEIKRASTVITGEGRIDNQTVFGKGPGRVASLGKKYGCKVIGLSGILNVPYEKCFEVMDDIIEIKPQGQSLEEAMRPDVAFNNIVEAVRNYYCIHNK